MSYDKWHISWLHYQRNFPMVHTCVITTQFEGEHSPGRAPLSSPGQTPAPQVLLSPSSNCAVCWISCKWRHRVCAESVVFRCYPFMILPCHSFVVTFSCTYHNLSLFHRVYTNFSSTGHTRYFLFLLLAFYLKGFTSEHSFILRYIS